MNGIRCSTGARSKTTCAVGRSARRSIIRFCACALAALTVVCVVMSVAGGLRLAGALLASTAPVIVLFSALAVRHTRLLRGIDDARVSSFGAANSITALRIFLVPPVLVLLASGEIFAGTVLFAAAALSDVADGVVARGCGRETILGVMLDPVGDMLGTTAVFTWLYFSGVVPGWLFGLLIVRYLQFFGGLAGLSASGRLPRLRATAVGKAAGVVQAVGIVILLLREAFPALEPRAPVERAVIPALAGALAAVIVSQTVIGIMAVRRDNAA